MEAEITISSGVVVVCRPIKPNVLDLFEDAHQMPTPPMREASIVGGGTELVPDEEDKGYLAELASAQRCRSEDLRLLILDHVSLKEEPDPEVLLKLERYGIEPTPENLLRYLMEDYVPDWGMLQREVLRLSTVTDEEVQKAIERFRDRLGRGVTVDEDGSAEESVQDGG